MKNMRQLINLMEGVMAVPGVGTQPGGAGGAEADMQTAGTATRNSAYAAYDASQGQATESTEDIGSYDAGKAAIKAKIVALRAEGKHELATHTYYREKEALDKRFPKEAAEEKAASLKAASDAWAGNNWQRDSKSGRSAVDEKSTSEKQARFMAAAAHNPSFAKKAGISQGVAKEFNQADKGTEQLSKAMKHKNECSMMEDIESPPGVVSCNQSNPANADKACAMENMEQEYSPEVQQAMADFENVVMNLGMAPEDAFERIKQRLSHEAVQEFGAALEAMGQREVDTMDDTLPMEEGPEMDEAKSDRYFSPLAYNNPDGSMTGTSSEDLRKWAAEEIQGFIQSVETDGEVPEDDVNYDFADHFDDIVNGDDETLKRAYGAVRAGMYETPERFIKICKAALNMLNGVTEAFDLQNGYDDINDASGNDYFPSGADSPVVRDTGPSGARQGDNPEQKKMQVDEVHKELVYGYRNFLKESAKK